MQYSYLLLHTKITTEILDRLEIKKISFEPTIIGNLYNMVFLHKDLIYIELHDRK